MSALSGASRLTRRLPASRAKVRAGRALTALVSAVGINPVTVTSLRDGSRLELDPRSRTEAGAFWEGEYEPDYVKLLQRLCDSFGGVAYDVGANVGMVSVPLARHVRPMGVVHCFEPVLVNYERLIRNLTLNALGHHATAHNIGLGADNVVTQIAREARHAASTGNAVVGTHLADRSCSDVSLVEIRRLDDFAVEVKLPLPDVIKLDVEGYEVAVLEGAQQVLTAARPLILGEFNSGYLPQFGHTFLDVPRLLPVGYEIYSFVDAHTVSRRKAVVGLGDVLLVPKEKVAALPLVVVA